MGENNQGYSGVYKVTSGENKGALAFSIETSSPKATQLIHKS